MFNFFKKPSTIKIDAYTAHPPSFNLTPIVKAHHTIPEWWKQLPVQKRDQYGFLNPNTRNMKTCAGFVDFFKRGVVLEYWNDLVILVNQSGWQEAWQSEPHHKDVSHSPTQWGSGFPNHYNIKLISPWLLKEDTGVSFLSCPATWHHDQINAPKILPGILNFKYQTVINVNMFVPVRKEPYEIKISRGTPLIHLFPLNDAPVEVQNHLVSNEQFDKIHKHTQDAHAGSYSIRKHLIDRNEQRQQQDQQSCPFSWLNFKGKR